MDWIYLAIFVAGIAYGYFVCWVFNVFLRDSK